MNAVTDTNEGLGESGSSGDDAGNAPDEANRSAQLAAASHSVVINDDDPGIAYSNGWQHSTGRPLDDLNHDVHYAQAEGSQLTYSFTGTGIDYVTEKENGQGSIDFYIDDAFQKTVDTQKADPREVQQTVYSATGFNVRPAYAEGRQEKQFP